MVTIGTVVVGVGDLRRAAAFWSAALDYEPRDAIDGDFAVLVPRRPERPSERADQGPGTHLALMVSGTPVQDRPRVHLDLYAADAAEQASEIERLVALGAERVGWDLYPDDPDFVVLADTEGNRFCVIDTSHP